MHRRSLDGEEQEEEGVFQGTAPRLLGTTQDPTSVKVIPSRVSCRLQLQVQELTAVL